MRILLLNPSWGGLVSGGRYNRRWPPLDLLNVGAILREDGHAVALLDARAVPVDSRDFDGEVAASDFVLVTTSPLDRWQCPNVEMGPLLAWTDRVPGEKLLLCGAHGTLFPERMLVLTGARALIRGEPEGAVRELFRALQGDEIDRGAVPSLSWKDASGAFHRAADAPPVDLARLPAPAHDLARPEDYAYELLGPRMALVETARGCPHRCVFCLKAMYGGGGRVRTKPLDRVEAELGTLGRLGFHRICFMDLEFTLNRARTVAICRMLKGFRFEWCCQTRVDAVDPGLLSLMATAGCRLVHYGIESGDAATLGRLGKGITEAQVRRAVAWTRAAGMASAGFFLLGFPGETANAVRETGRLARSLPLTYVSFHYVTPYFGTELGAASGVTAPWWEPEGACAAGKSGLGGLYLRFYLRPKVWLEIMKRGIRPLRLARLLAGFRGVLPRKGAPY